MEISLFITYHKHSYSPEIRLYLNLFYALMICQKISVHSSLFSSQPSIRSQLIPMNERKKKKITSSLRDLNIAAQVREELGQYIYNSRDYIDLDIQPSGVPKAENPIKSLLSFFWNSLRVYIFKNIIDIFIEL